MNGWDAFTWFCSVTLAGCGIVIFAYFLRDVGGILNRVKPDDDNGDENGDDGDD